jgi:hypothetical protein
MLRGNRSAILLAGVNIGVTEFDVMPTYSSFAKIVIWRKPESLGRVEIS